MNIRRVEPIPSLLKKEERRNWDKNSPTVEASTAPGEKPLLDVVA